ncbi:hypothetical protein RM550_09315 [Streptomyces sp. DSM 41527]|uniref:GNAT family N-acetyltransferase n=1 Tax=Streptomyces mooreae TaxID=3075523 RepID=A0ABU2T3X7_9ACTN|nr:hypothetical protein [Streptomyces sp. DSM 41527]MDT0455936.1 hypothetical protein [Streptomyces sp. DSM 41527]
MTTDDDARAATEFRDIPEADCDRALDLTYSVFHLTPGDKTRRRHAWMLRAGLRVGAYDGGQLAGVAGAHRLDNRPLRLIDPAEAPAVLAPHYDATWRGGPAGSPATRAGGAAGHRTSTAPV